MTNTLQRLVRGTRTLEARLTWLFEHTAQAVAGRDRPSPLEVIDRAADELVRQVHPAGRGRYVCPFNRAVLTFVAATAEAQARVDAVCAGPPSLRDRVRERLRSIGCIESDLEVSVAYAPVADPTWERAGFHLALGRVEEGARRGRGAVVRIDALVTSGTADRGAYTFTTLPIAIGRGAEVRDGRRQLVRVNQIAFLDGGDDVNQSVSRRHARIELDAASGRPRLVDDNSAQGTSIIRGGRGVAVPRGSRGLALQSEDEIVLGQARLSVRVS
jgi:hypothetical protein